MTDAAIAPTAPNAAGAGASLRAVVLSSDEATVQALADVWGTENDGTLHTCHSLQALSDILTRHVVDVVVVDPADESPDWASMTTAASERAAVTAMAVRLARLTEAGSGSRTAPPVLRCFGSGRFAIFELEGP